MKDFIEVKTKRYRYVRVQKEIRRKGAAQVLFGMTGGEKRAHTIEGLITRFHSAQGV
jgi:hypothetical protein